MPEVAKIRVVVVDDDPIVRDALTSYVAAAGDLQVTASFADGRDLVDALDTLNSDVVLMDVRMPQLDGVSATRLLLASRPSIRVLLLTSFEQEADVEEGFAAGAVGFLTKTASPSTLVNAIRTVHHGAAVLPAHRVTQVLGNKGRTSPAAPPVGLSDRETEVLTLLCRAYSNAEIGEALCLSESTIKTHVSSLMAKLGVNSRLKAAMRAREWGLVLTD